jgi:hypothetical protein
MAMRLELDEIHVGAKYTAYGVLDHRGRSEFGRLYDSLSVEHRKTLLKRVRTLCAVGPSDMPNCPRVDTQRGIWKLRSGERVRVYFFTDGARLVLTGGELKRQRADDPRCLARARQCRDEYLGTMEQ